MSKRKKAKTIIERFGFKDDELKTPEHDKMLIWLFNKKNCLKMLKELDCFKMTNEG